MTELGYFALGFGAGIVFTFASLISVGRWLKRVSGSDTLPPSQPPMKKTRTSMWD